MKATFYIILLSVFASITAANASNHNDSHITDSSFITDSIKDSSALNKLPVSFPQIEQTDTDSVASELHFANKSEALEFMKESGNWDKFQKGIIPKMLDSNLEYATKLLNNRHDGFIVVDKGRMKLIRFNRFGQPEATYGIACGKNYGTKHKRNDCRTPEGFFSIKKIQNSTEWKYVDDEGNVSQKTGEYGPRFIRLDIPGISSIGIHGTCAPWSIGSRRSHGCIRLNNENLMQLVENIEIGMPVIVSPGTRDQRINKEEGVDIPRISTTVNVKRSFNLAQR